MAIITLLAFALGLCAPLLDAQRQHSLLGRHALILSAAASAEPGRILALADGVLSQGASVTLLVPLPRSGAAARDEDALRLLLRTQRQGFPKLMAALGFAWGTPGQYGTGNRQRVDVKHVRADDGEALTLAMVDADLLIVHAPSGRALAGVSASGADGEAAAPSADLTVGERRARFAMLRETYSFVIRRLRQDSCRLRRDSLADDVRWAWLAAAAGAGARRA